MNDERSAAINIGGKEYELILTTRATKAIAGRYGGLENLGEKVDEIRELRDGTGRDSLADYITGKPVHFNS